MSGASLTASGALKDTPLCELLVYFSERGLSGTLILESPGSSKHALLFARGDLIRVKVDNPQTRLGAILTSLGFSTAEACEEVGGSTEDELFGQQLLARGLEPSQLQWGLHQQLVQQLRWLSQLPGGSAFGYYEGVDFLKGWGGKPLDIDVLSTVWAAVSHSAATSRMLNAYASVSAITLRLHRSSRIGGFGFDAKEKSVLDVLRVMPQSLQKLRATQLADDKLLQRLIYSLVITGHLDVGKPPLAVTDPLPCYSPPPSSRAEPPRKAPEVAPQPEPTEPEECGEEVRDTTATAQFLVREEIVARMAALEQLTAYELLELPSDCSSSDIGSAFARLAKRWHPDRLSPPCADLKGSVTRVFSKITEARRQLSNPETRKEYDAQLGGAPLDEEQEQVQQILNAAAAFQKAEILVKKRRLGRAEELARQASEQDPDQAEYAALYAWIRSSREDCAESELKTAIRELQSAALQQKDNTRIRYYLATALKRTGDEAGAMREFKFVAARDPSNLDAAREIRLFSMRSPGADRPAATGLFGRLFKR